MTNKEYLDWAAQQVINELTLYHHTLLNHFAPDDPIIDEWRQVSKRMAMLAAKVKIAEIEDN